MGRDAADHLAFEVFHDLRAPPLPPLTCRPDRLPVFQGERIGQIRKRIGPGFVVVGVIGGFFIAARPRTEGLDAELVHHVAMVLFCCPVHRLAAGRRENRSACGRALCLLPRGHLTCQDGQSAQGGDSSCHSCRACGSDHVLPLERTTLSVCEGKERWLASSPNPFQRSSSLCRPSWPRRRVSSSRWSPFRWARFSSPPKTSPRDGAE